MTVHATGAEFALAGKLTPNWQIVTPFVVGQMAESNEVGGFVGVIPSGDKILAMAFFLNSDYSALPLFLRHIIVHEILGHLPQYLSVLEKYGQTDGLTRFLDPEFMQKFNVLTHTTAPLMESEFYRAVPKQLLVDEINGSALPQGTKDAFLGAIDAYHSQPDKKEFIKSKLQIEACLGLNPPNPNCVSDADFEDMIKHFEGLGVVLL